MIFQSALPSWTVTRFRRWLSRAYIGLSNLGWRALLGLATVHASISYILLWIGGEQGLLGFNDFTYFYVTTSTTVGYGDLSPSTTMGRYVVILWVMPGGISLLSTVIAKLVSNISSTWRKAMIGLANYSHLQGHIVIIGYQPERTAHMVRLLRGDLSERRDIVLVTANLPNNPLPEEVKYVRTNTLTAPEIAEHCGLRAASLVIVYGRDDNETLTAALAAGAANDSAHMVCYFDNRSSSDILKLHCPEAECVVSVAVENMVRTAQDPGSSSLVSELLSTLEGETQFSFTIPVGIRCSYWDLFCALKQHCNATVLGLRCEQGKETQLNPPNDQPIGAGDRVYYMAAQRIDISQSKLSAWLAQ